MSFHSLALTREAKLQWLKGWTEVLMLMGFGNLEELGPTILNAQFGRCIMGLNKI